MNSLKYYPLTSVQQEIWLDQMLHADLPVYNIGGYLKIKGSVDRNRFEHAIRQLISENDALRIILHEELPVPIQEFRKKISAEIPFYDFSDHENASQKALELMQEEFRRLFQIYETPLFCFMLIKVSDDSYYWFQKYHHLIIDEWAVSLCIRRVASAYNRLCGHGHEDTRGGLANPPPDADSSSYTAFIPDARGGLANPPPDADSSSYTAFIRDDREYLNSQEFSVHQNYWLAKYSQVPGPLIPRRYDPKAVQSGSASLCITRHLFNQMADFAQTYDAEPFHFILSALYVYFQRTSGEETFVVGLPFLNRDTEAFKQTVGLFTGMIPSCFAFGRDLNFKELIVSVGKSLREDYLRQRFPMSEINRSLGICKEGRRQLFDIAFSYEKYDHEICFDGISAEPVVLSSGFSQTALSITIREYKADQDMILDLSYNTGCFRESEIELIKARFIFLFEEILRYPDIPVGDMNLLPKEESHQILIRWNHTDADYPSDKCIHHLFEAQADRMPDAPALIFEDERITYRELNARANHLARVLLSLDMEPGSPVGIHIERSAEMIVGLMGILKSGAPYVPMDPAFPSHRLGYMVEDSELSVVVTQQSLLSSVPDYDLKCICTDTIEPLFGPGTRDNPITQVHPGNLAYIMFTSGSTGRPKGVQISHRAVVNFLNTMGKEPGLTDQDILLSVTTISFDISVLEIFLPLIKGGVLVVADQEACTDGHQLQKLMNDHDVTIMQATPATWRLLEESGWQGSPNLKVLCGGEPLPPDLGETLLRKLVPDSDQGAGSLWNMYGPTETTIWSTTEQITNARDITIGRPIDNTSIYILDSRMQPVPVGVAGLLYIGGHGLSEGYIKRPKLTAEKFVQNPFGDDPENRIYNTGDLARYLPDGRIECLGRVDSQVKIRGFRIELGEIESALTDHPGILKAAVIVWEAPSEDKQLAAYIVADKNREITRSELRAHLKDKLPDYMFPGVYVFMDELPLTPNGKIDRKALPEPDPGDASRVYVPPRNQVQEIIASVWAEVLHCKQVGIEDNFFELGGHSLLAIRIISRIREAFHTDLPVRAIFESPCIAELSERIASVRYQKDELMTLPIPVIPRDKEIPLSFAQQRLWFMDQFEERQSPVYNMPIAMRISGELNTEMTEKVLNEIIRRHESLRTIFPAKHGQAIQTILPNLRLSLRIADASGEDEAMRMAVQEGQKPFDLSEGPLIRASLLKPNQGDPILLITMHHIVSDDWSVSIFMREFEILYKAFSQDAPSLLPEFRIQYADFGEWQRKRLAGDITESQLKYWKKQLAHAPELSELPADRSRPPVQGYNGRTISFGIHDRTAEQLRHLSQKSGVSLFMTLFAGFAAMLHRYTGQEDILVGSPVANRNHKDTEALIGFFLNNLVFRTDLSGDPLFTVLLERVRDMTLDAYANQDIPFEQLVDELRVRRDISHHPFFQVMFVQNTPVSSVKLPGLTMTPVEIEYNTTMFDLSLLMEESETELRGAFEYNRDMFDADTIMRMTGHFQTLLEGIAENPERKISQLPMMTQAEKRQVLVEWNDTVAKPELGNEGKCLHHLFEEQANEKPNAQALLFEDQSLTYSELNSRANQIACHLLSQGVRPDMLVGLCVERSVEMIVGILGILKAGGAYVPIDPEYPEKRIEFMLKDSNVSLLLTQEKVMNILPPVSADIVSLDTFDFQLAGNGENPISGAEPENLAYLLYTSGSTGKPKGVMVSHGAITGHLCHVRKYYQMNPDDRVLQFASVSFDGSVVQIFSALTSGAALVLRDNSLWSVSDFCKNVSNYNITVAEFPPLYLSQLLKDSASFPDQLRLVISAGDILPMETTASYYQLPVACSVRLLNEYGPTETTITATIFEISPGDEQIRPRRSIPIGRPLPNRKIYILDCSGNPVPIGVPGEIHIGGSGLARGYLNRPELTREKFVPDPFSNDPKARVYKTGDLARWFPDGNIEFLGRIDQQVSLRGFRIEPGEIETVLSEHPAVENNAVAVKERNARDKQLVAYVVKKPGNELHKGALREYLRKRLPDYMIPSFFIFMESLPLTNNGKIDRDALPEPDQHDIQQEYAAPRNSAEEIMTSVWEKVLNRRQIGIYDNFFELGGHSLQAVKLVSALSEKMNTEITLKFLFLYPSVADMAENLFLEQAGSKDSQIPDLSEEAVLDIAIRVTEVSASYVTEPRDVFLTGATGFLGIFLLKEILRQTKARVHCLIRSGDPGEGIKRLKKTAEKYELQINEHADRIIAIPGTLDAPLFGLSRQDFDALSEKIQAIYHNGAMVNFLYPYELLKGPNVSGTKEVIRLSCRRGASPIHYISTLDVLGSHPVQKECELGEPEGLADGYAQSKWVAEKLVTEAGRQGLPVCVYRPSRVIGTTESGAWNTEDFMCRFIKACILLQSAPEDHSYENMIPADTAASAIVWLSRQNSSLKRKIFHVANPVSTHKGILTDFIKKQGHHLKTLSYEKWYQRLNSYSEDMQDHDHLQTLIPFFSEPLSGELLSSEESVDCTNFSDALKESGIAVPEIDYHLFEKYFEYFDRIGWISEKKGEQNQ